ncbi:MAG: trypsin-like peptidase domain-containing protein [Chthoniobacterales bacterium]
MNRFILTLGCGLLIQAAAVAQNSNPASKSAASGLARAMSDAFADVYEKVSPGVVVIEAIEAAEQQSGTPLMQFFLQPPMGGPRGAINQGSGFLMTADGYILTNSHVLEGARPDGLRVTIKDGRKFEARVVGIDEKSDLAVLKINASGLPVVPFGDSDKSRVGEFAFALGAPFDLRYTFTYGIISAKGRTDLVPTHGNYAEYIQTDAAINPGNSGGPLVDIDGRVIGVNTLIYGMDQGLGFAIPINMAKKIAGQLISGGRAVRAWLGIAIRALDDEPGFARQFPDAPKQGIIVEEIMGGTPASQSDLQPYDVITKVDGTTVSNPRELQKLIFEKQVGDEVELQVWRGSGIVKMKLRTAEQIDGAMPVVHQRRQSVQLPGDEQELIDDPSADQAQNPNVPPSPTAGLELKQITPQMATTMKLQAQEGVLVTSVQPGSAASEAGVKVGDVITSVASSAVRTQEDFVAALGKAADGDAVMLNINRGDGKTYAILKH